MPFTPFAILMGQCQRFQFLIVKKKVNTFNKSYYIFQYAKKLVSLHVNANKAFQAISKWSAGLENKENRQFD